MTSESTVWSNEGAGARLWVLVRRSPYGAHAGRVWEHGLLWPAHLSHALNPTLSYM